MRSKQKLLVTPWIFAACFFCFCLSGLPVAAQDSNTLMLEHTGKAFSSVVKKAGPAVVYISTEKEVKGFSGSMMGVPEVFLRRFFGDQFEQFQQQPRRMPNRKAQVPASSSRRTA